MAGPGLQMLEPDRDLLASLGASRRGPRRDIAQHGDGFIEQSPVVLVEHGMDNLGLHLWRQVQSARWAIVAARGRLGTAFYITPVGRGWARHRTSLAAHGAAELNHVWFESGSSRW